MPSPQNSHPHSAADRAIKELSGFIFDLHIKFGDTDMPNFVQWNINSLCKQPVDYINNISFRKGGFRLVMKDKYLPIGIIQSSKKGSSRQNKDSNKLTISAITLNAVHSKFIQQTAGKRQNDMNTSWSISISYGFSLRLTAG